MRKHKGPKYSPVDQATEALAGNREEIVANGRRWVKVNAAKPWKPAGDGDVLVARFLSRATRPGDNGRTYGVVTLGTPRTTCTSAGCGRS